MYRQALAVWALLLWCDGSSAHPQPGTPPDVTCDAARPQLAPIQSYHAHVQFLPNSNSSVATARAVHAAFVLRFFGAQGQQPHCTGLYDQGQLCTWQSDPCMGPIGPFATGQWAAFIPTAALPLVLGWFQQHRQGLSVLVHPNTGCGELDHST